MNKLEIVRKMVKAQVLLVNYVERHTNLACETYRDIDRILKGGKLTLKYGEAIDNLYKNTQKYAAKCEVITTMVNALKEAINNSDIKDLRFGVEPQNKFTEEEKELDKEIVARTLYMNNNMVTPKELCKILNGKVSEAEVIKACEDEILLNTNKPNGNWMVHIYECRAYWNIPEEDEKALYKNVIY